MLYLEDTHPRLLTSLLLLAMPIGVLLAVVTATLTVTLPISLCMGWL